MYTDREIRKEKKDLEPLELSELFARTGDRDYAYNYLAARELGRKIASKYLKPAAETEAISDAMNLEAHVDLLMLRISEMIDDAAKVGHNFIIVAEDSFTQIRNLETIAKTALESQGYTIELMETDIYDYDEITSEPKSLTIPFYKISW